VPAEPERFVLASIPDVEDLELRVCLVYWPGHPEFGSQLEVVDYIPSRDLYARGHLFDARHGPKVIAAMRNAKAAGMEAAAREVREAAS
jgi:hypothetical protein